MKQTIFQLLLVSVFGFLFSACDPNRVFETNEQIKDYNWEYKDVKTFKVEIQDTAARYNLIVNMRHSFQFEWRNVYVQIATQSPDSSLQEKRVNLILAEPDGKWFGNCMGDNCDMHFYIQSNAIFPKKGIYTFKIRQDMRVNPLPLLKSIGLRVEKVTK